MPGPRGGLGPRGFLTEEEKQNMPKVTKDLLKRILSYLKPYWKQFILVFITILLSAAVGLLPSIITGKIVDQALVGENMELLIQLLLMALAALFASQIIGIIESYINAWISQQIIFDMKNEMYKHLQFMPHSFFTTEKQGDIITRMNTDISGVSTVISGTLASIVSNLATVVTTLVALFSMSWQLAVCGIIVIPLLVLPTKTVGKTRYKLLTQSQAKNDELNQVINETLSVSGSMLVKLFTREQKEYDKFVGINKEVTQLSIKEMRSGKWFMVIMGMFTQLGPLLIYFAGGYLIINHIDTTLTVGTITATVALINRLYRPVESLLNISVDFTRSLALFTRIFDYLDRENTITNPEDGKKPEVKDQPIEYSHVSFGYDPNQLILTDVNFTVPGGKMYAVVGPSGSGKSTVVNLIPRLYDVCGGTVRIAGVDVRDFDLPYLRQQIGVVTQDTYLFNGTILENLRYANDDATDEQIQEACKIANIHDFIISQPDGYNTEVGNRGLKLSGGEKQRLSIARVILKDPKILILDEATSALDSISESSIQDALEAMMVGRTSIVIAHRLSTILKADSILVVKDGIIKENGTHDELLKLNGVYRELYETQFRDAIEYEEAHGANGERGLNIETLSSQYEVRKIKEAAIGDVFHLSKMNGHYYRTTNTDIKDRNLTEVVTELPDESGNEGKYFVGFYDSGNGLNKAAGDSSSNMNPGGESLTAVLDLITGYPDEKSCYIGWFMVDAEKQGAGVGSSIFADVRAAMKGEGYERMAVGVYKNKESAFKFWEDHGFVRSGKELEKNGRTTVILEREI